MDQQQLSNALGRVLSPDRVKTRLIDLVAYAADAGFYYLRPQAVVLPVNEEEVRALFRFSHQSKIPLCFRAAGTSLSGQSVTDGILVDLSRYWKQIKVEEEGLQVRVEPGVIGAMV
ncbi:MAG TPA: FAD-binding oxidoreductase, partial [Chitinophagaceae bacterium]|nr:FAD-binding oxidoreductase [Chitinophagaceae bacterium]